LKIVSDREREELEHLELVVGFWGIEGSLDRIRTLLDEIQDLVKKDEE